MSEPAALVRARTLAVINAADDPAETRRALEGKQTIRAYAASLDTTSEQLVTDLLDWLAANPAVLADRDMYVEANACDRLCRVLGVAVPDGLREACDAALARLVEATEMPEVRLSELLHRPTSERYNALREEFLHGCDAATLEALVERLRDPHTLWAANQATREAGR
jgi:hypothetical protein